MSWSLTEIQHNASILYNYIDSENLYVDFLGLLQIDDREDGFWLPPLGDYSTKTTSKVALRTFEAIIDAVEEGKLEEGRIIPLPPKSTYHFFEGEDAPVSLTNDPHQKWVSLRKFAKRIIKAGKLNRTMNPARQDDLLTSEERACRKLQRLAYTVLLKS